MPVAHGERLGRDVHRHPAGQVLAVEERPEVVGAAERRGPAETMTMARPNARRVERFIEVVPRGIGNVRAARDRGEDRAQARHISVSIFASSATWINFLYVKVTRSLGSVFEVQSRARKMWTRRTRPSWISI